MELVLLLYPVIVLAAVFSISALFIKKFRKSFIPNHLVGKRYIAETPITDEIGIIEEKGRSIPVKSCGKSCGGFIAKGTPVLVVGYLYDEEMYIVDKFV